MSASEAKKQLIATLEESARHEAKEKLLEIEKVKQEAKDKAMAIISLATQRLASEYAGDKSVSVVQLPSDEMKGRIIGREGRNIRALEQATGVDLIIDDTPEAVIISCFNPLKREIAKKALEHLIEDGRIHPARIEETVKRLEEELPTVLKEHGENAAYDLGITDLHPELLTLLGKLKFKTIGTHSILQHSIETAHICGIIAQEIGLNIKQAKRAGLLHEIGKAVDNEKEGHHSKLGAELCTKHGETEEICEAIAQHQSDDLESASKLATILEASNLLSENRPGAKQEAWSNYIKRLEEMERIVLETKHVEKAYVIQAGREVRAMVNSGDLSDDEVSSLSEEVASKLRNQLAFPGQIKITVSKESKQIDYAT